VVVMKSSVFWAMPCNPLNVNQHFGGTCHFHLRGWRVSQTRNHHEAGSKLHIQAVISKTATLTMANSWFIHMLDFRFSQPWLWRILSSEIQCSVVQLKSADVLEENVTSIFRV
jgi:hypothetical protein